MISDEMLAQKTLDGEIAAFEEIVERYKKSVFTIVYRMVGHYQEAEDISQDVFVTVYEKLYQFDRNKKFKPWIHRIAVNTCISNLRRRKRMTHLSFDESINSSSPQVDWESPILVYEKKELEYEIKSALAKLPDNYRIVITLRYQLDLTNQEIAEIMGITRQNVEVKVHRARKALRKILLEKEKKGGGNNEMSGS